jgi:hypothetical protein
MKANGADLIGEMCRGLNSGGTGDENATPVPGWHGGGGDFLLQPALS